MQLFGLLDAKTALEGGKKAAFTKGVPSAGKGKKQ
jgi:hypothetical protein